MTDPLIGIWRLDEKSTVVSMTRDGCSSTEISEHIKNLRPLVYEFSKDTLVMKKEAEVSTAQYLGCEVVDGEVRAKIHYPEHDFTEDWILPFQNGRIQVNHWIMQKVEDEKRA